VGGVGGVAGRRAKPAHRMPGPRAGGDHALDRGRGVSGQARQLLGHTGSLAEPSGSGRRPRRRSRRSTRGGQRRHIHGVRTLPNLRASPMAPAAVTAESGTTGSPAARSAVTVQVLHVFSR